jgi:putative endonuclease
MRESYVYILASNRNGTLYVGVTSDLEKRIQEHKLKIRKGFSSNYNVTKLVYYETYFDIQTAIHREKCIKKWNRKWKLDLIESNNIQWDDLWPGFPPSRE